jgi:hypothetical protein
LLLRLLTMPLVLKVWRLQQWRLMLQMLYHHQQQQQQQMQ